ncbi:MAG: LapA family protein [Deltaproteobacteria bacterium]|nr:LapA family protein [Deltaproteobacteria bacterium]MBW2576468.1 LapA family protein [Deltaproteobacteria bacterium]
MRLARRLITVAVFVALLVLGWKFAASNGQPVVVHHPAGEFAARALWVVLLVAFGSGVVLAAIIASLRGARIRLVSRRYRKLVDSLQAEVHQLRSLPLSDQPVPIADPAPTEGLERGS